MLLNQCLPIAYKEMKYLARLVQCNSMSGVDKTPRLMFASVPLLLAGRVQLDPLFFCV